MREGFNPEKIKNEVNKLKKHRIIIVFYIPSSEGYYVESISVLDKCLNSIINTVNFNYTSITLINNNSISDCDKVINKYTELGYIDKYVVYSENKGKVYAVLNEARSSYEPFITISDADILFYSGWEKSIFDIFAAYPRAGTVSPYPCPYLTFYFNRSVFLFETLFRRIKYGKIVADEDIDLYVKGTNLPNIIKRKSRYNWKEKQYYLNGSTKAIVGAYHVVSTYRSEIFRNVYTVPTIKFKNSYEAFFLDYLSEKSGMYRLSTVKTYAYHIGNKLESVVENYTFDNLDQADEKNYFIIKNAKILKPTLVIVLNFIGRVFIEFYWNSESVVRKRLLNLMKK